MIHEEIVNIRIDDRLIHGQVATTWIRHLKADRIMVVDEFAVKNSLQKTALKMACPPQVKLSILSPPKAASNIKNGNYKGERVLLIVKSPETIISLLENGLSIKEINVGNMSATKDTKPVKKAVNVTSQDKEQFLDINSKGIDVTAQLVPTEASIDFMEALKKVN